jgi:hypothetical protein
MLVLQDITFILVVPLRKRLMHLIKGGWITFEGTPNMSTNSTQSCFKQWIRNALETECPRNLKGPMIKSGCKEGSMKIGVCGFLSTPF